MAETAQIAANPPDSKPASGFALWLLGGGSPPRAGIAAVLLATAFVYSRCLGNDFVFDDREEIVFNPYIGNWSFVAKSLFSDAWWFRDPLHQSRYYRPLMNVWLWLNYHLFGLNPAGWHAAMIALHLVAVWLAFRVATLLSGDRWIGLFAAALFGLMPIHAQAVVWPAAIAPLMCGTFELASLEYFLCAFGLPESDGRRTRLSAISIGLFAGALLSYDSSIAFPFIIAAYCFIRPHEPADGAHVPQDQAGTVTDRIRDTANATAPYIVALVGYLLLRLWALNFIFRPHMHNHMTLAEIALTIPGAIAGYAMAFVVPWMAGPAQRLNIVTGIADQGFYFPVLGLSILCGAAFLLIRSNRRRLLYLFYAAFILIALGPMLNLRAFQDQLAIQDRYAYFASFGFCMFLADYAVSFARRNDRLAPVVWIGATGITLLYAGTLFWVQQFWHDDLALFQRCVDVVPDAGTWHSRLGLVLEARGDYRGARSELETADRLDKFTEGVVLHDLSLVDEHLNDPAAAARVMAKAVERAEDPPPVAYTDLAIAREAAGDSAGAEEALKHAAAMPGGANVAELAHAQIRLMHGDAKGTEDAVRELLKHAPDYVAALNVLGAVLSSEHRYDEALQVYRHGATVVPTDSDLHYRIALILHKLGRDGEAYPECSAALAGAPQDPKMLSLMAEIKRGPGAH